MNEGEQQAQMPSVEIRSTRGKRCFRLHDRDGDYFIATVEGDGLRGSKGVYSYTDGNHLVNLFRSIAKDWRGWEGERCWESIEGDLRIAIRSSRTGEITMRITLQSEGGYDDWRLEAPIFTEAGQLESIAHQVALFFEST